MATATGALIAAHVICTTLGYAGLICANLWLVVMLRLREPALSGPAVRSSLQMNRIFGPLLGAGILLGIAVMIVMHVPASSLWLASSFAVIVLALALQAAVAIPWHIRSLRAISSGADPSTMLSERTPSLISAAFVVAFALIVLLMVMRPHTV
jgi:hypothetical protein